MVDLEVNFRFTKSPSYLKELLKYEEEICLVHNKKPRIKVEGSVTSSSDADTSFDSANLDLTGCPLKTDLHGETLSDTFIFDRPNNWTDEEIHHIPITLGQARQFINNYNKKKSSGGTVPPVYCICDGSDKKQTVILGAQVSDGVFARTQVFIVGIFARGHHNLSIDYMKKEHLKNVGVANAEVEYKVTSSFGIYGYNLMNCPAFVNIEHRGSILIEVSWNTCEYDIPNTKADYQITLQIIAGHTDSQVNGLWEDMNFLEYCINLLSNRKLKHLENEKLNASADCLEDVLDSIDGVLSSERYRRRLRVQEKQQVLDFKSLKEANLLTELWNILRRCETVSNLRSCLHYIFEHTTKSDSKLHLPENNSTFMTIMSGIYNGKLAVPTLSFQQSLELLVEFGLEKVKNDYSYIIGHFCSVPLPTLMADWNKLSSTSPENSTQAAAARRTEYTRSTRMTFNFGASGNELLNREKLKHLARMHAIVEFLLLLQDHSEFSEEVYQFVAESACNKYMASNSPIHNFAALQKNRLCDLTITLDTVDASIKDKTPVKWHMQMRSKHNDTEVTTIFLQSEDPIFPSAVFINYDLSLDCPDKELYYVTELVQYKTFMK